VTARLRRALDDAGVPSIDYTLDAWGWPVQS